MPTIGKYLQIGAFLALCPLVAGQHSQAAPPVAIDLPPGSPAPATLSKPISPQMERLEALGPLPAPEFGFTISNTEYLGQGRFRVSVDNTGNYTIQANRLQVNGLYYIEGSLVSVTHPFDQAITAGQTAFVEVSGLDEKGECYNLTSIDVHVVDTVTEKNQYHDLRVSSLASLSSALTFSDVGFNQGFFQHTLTNAAPYPLKVSTIITNIEIWDTAKPAAKNKGSILDRLWGLLTDGFEFDTSGLQEEELKCRARDILVTPRNLSAAGALQTSPNWWIPVADLQEAIRGQCPEVTFTDFSQIVKNLTIQAYTENLPACPAKKNLKTTFIPEMGRGKKIFSW